MGRKCEAARQNGPVAGFVPDAGNAGFPEAAGVISGVPGLFYQMPLSYEEELLFATDHADFRECSESGVILSCDDLRLKFSSLLYTGKLH